MKLSVLAVKITVFARKKKEFWIKTYFYRFLDKKNALNRLEMSDNSWELPPPLTQSGLRTLLPGSN